MIQTVFLILLLSGLTYAKEPIHYRGTAYTHNTRELLYTDEYREYYSDKGVLSAEVTYRDPSKNIIASKAITYNSGYSTPSFTISNHYFESIESIIVSNNTVSLVSKSSGNAALKKKTIRLPENPVIDAGFHYFLLSNWDRLIQKKAVSFSYVMPSSLKTVTLEIKEIKRSIWKERKTIVFHIEPKNMVLKLFIAPIKLRYDFITKDMLSFEGFSNLKFTSGPKQIYLEIDTYLKR
jgi:hypothetical protein